MKGHKRSFASEVWTVIGALAGFSFAATLFAGGGALASHKTRTRTVRDAAQMGGQQGSNDAEHASLAKLAGEYDRVVKFVGQTGAMAQPSSGTSKFSVVLGGRFVLEESHDIVFGRPVEGLRIYGYNSATKQYEMARMYTMSNGITLMKGTSSDGGKTIEYVGEAGTAGTGNNMPLHATFRQISEDQFSVTMSTADANGKDAPFQETDYTRKK